MRKDEFFKKVINIYTLVGFFFIILSLILIFIPIFPYIWYRINPDATQQEIELLKEDVIEEINILEPKEDILNTEKEIPGIDPNLPQGYYINIESINVLSPISSDPNYDEALRKGSWMVPEYGTPERDDLPIIIAAHRFGYQYWGKEERELISFYNLPKTNTEEYIDIYWDQRKYTYQIYKAEESTYISEYEADLILYTCKYFNSPVRIFRYANLVDENTP